MKLIHKGIIALSLLILFSCQSTKIESPVTPLKDPVTTNGLVQTKDAVSISNEISSEVEHLFYTKDFELINKMDDKFKDEESRLPDGRWNLTFIYSNLGKISEKGAEQEWQHQLQLVDEWITRTPNHPAPYLAKAEILISYAFDARGNGWAKDVKNEQWTVFHSRIAKAAKVLQDSDDITGNHPFFYLKMLNIAKLQSWPPKEFLILYELASSQYPSYYFIHFIAADYFQPRWLGSKEKLRMFAYYAVKKSNEKEGMTLYTRIFWSQLWALNNETFAEGYAEWPLMKQGFEDIMKDYPNSNWNLNAFGYYACMAKDWSTTKELIDKIGNKYHLSIWGSRSKYYSCKSFAEDEFKNDLQKSEVI